VEVTTQSAQCPATTIDRATDEETRCILAIGHEGRHDDGCLTWTWGDVWHIFGTATVTAADPVRFTLGTGASAPTRPAIRIEPTPHRWVCFVDGRPENWYGETPELALRAMRDGTNEHKENDDAT